MAEGLELGKKFVEAGEDVTVVGWGAMLRRIVETVPEVDADVEVIDLRTVYSMDTEPLVESVRKTGRCVIVHEAPRTNGIAAEIAARIDESAIFHREAPIER